MSDIPEQNSNTGVPSSPGKGAESAIIRLLADLPEASRREGESLRALLAEFQLQRDIQLAGALLPAIQLGHLDAEDIDQSHPELAGLRNLVVGATGLPRPGETMPLDGAHPDEAAQVENIRKMLLAMVEDIRTIIIRLAQELLYLRSIKDADEETRREAARTDFAVYAPLANRLGIWQIKWELEDLAFRYAEPDTYRRIARALAEKRTEREEFIAAVLGKLHSLLEENGIRGQVKGRPKHIYSIWKKMQKKQVELDELYDLRAVRVLVDSVKDCYTVLGIVHGEWRHIPKEFDDYIATPKGNNYQSLHTAVIGPADKAVEIQIRTWDMHNHAELGVAAHWRYKEGGSRDIGLEEKIAWLRQLLEAEGDDDFIDRFQDEVFQDRIYALTPRGGVIDLPGGSTPVDFAYHVHTEVGHRCRGAKVNGRIVPLTHELQTGDRVEILTSKTGEPSRDWLSPHAGYVKSSRARDKIRYFFRQQSHEENLARGREIIERELERYDAAELDAADIARHLKLPDADAVYLAVGAGDLSSHQVGNAIQRLTGPVDEFPENFDRTRSKKAAGVSISGVDDLLSHPARCCQPLPPDPIRGFITRGRGVSIHRQDCPHLLKLEEEEPQRIIAVEWGDTAGERHNVDIRVDAYDRQGLLRDITSLMSEEKTHIMAVNTQRDDANGSVRIDLTVEIADIDQLGRLLNRIAALPNVFKAHRRMHA
ncbi:MAG: bifunctional (p)ppGpp synthetase/guanosine-3',5'-bis(diphosphate) 3'-pyrophosphohydrolase [Gammaproteobacteria bacterium]|nr:bifunctional (p)ppGpp synthetase/guanosine-3',5'-bis(diphosphate) 3'-pyrophosphohydrolase [Gammaproteobacteria bacterium]